MDRIKSKKINFPILSILISCYFFLDWAESSLTFEFFCVYTQTTAKKILRLFLRLFDRKDEVSGEGKVIISARCCDEPDVFSH